MIQDESVCNELNRGISKDEDYKASVEHLYKLAGVSELKDSVLPKIDTHIEKFNVELDRCAPVKLDENNKKSDGDDLLNRNNSSKSLSTVLYKFIENPNFNANFNGQLYEYINAYLSSIKGDKDIINSEKDIHKNVNGEVYSFIKFNYTKKIGENFASSVVILFSEHSNEIYVFKGCSLIYPINRNDVSSYGGECIVINDENNNHVDESELINKLDGIIRKDEIEKEKEQLQLEVENSLKEKEEIIEDITDIENEKEEEGIKEEITDIENEKEKIEKAEEEFKKRFAKYGELDSKELLPFVFYYIIFNRREELLNDFASTFRPLIDGDSIFKMPVFKDEDGIERGIFMCDEYNPKEIEAPQSDDEKEYDNIIEEFHSFNEKVSKYENEINQGNGFKEVNGDMLKAEIERIPLYLVPLYFCANTDLNEIRDPKEYISFTAKISGELIKNADVILNSKEKSKIFADLLDLAIYEGMPEILHFNEKHNIGFHSQNETDKNILVSFLLRTMERFMWEEESVEGSFDISPNAGMVLKFIVEKCGQDICKQMSANSQKNLVMGKDGKKGKPNESFFSNKLDEWIYNYNKSNSFIHNKNDYKERMKEIYSDITECFTRKYIQNLKVIRRTFHQ